MEYLALGDDEYLFPRQQDAPAEVYFLHVGKESVVESAGFAKEFGPDKEAGSRCPEYFRRGIVLSVVRLYGREDASPAVRVTVFVNKASGCSGVFKKGTVAVRFYFGLAGSCFRMLFAKGHEGR